MHSLTLISHHLCPYVQRAAISLYEKGVPFEKTYIDLVNKPAWFTALSPLGKVPLLRVQEDGTDATIFESAVILEYLEETQAPAMHPVTPLSRAHHRSWIEVASAMLNDIARLYSAADELTFLQARENITEKAKRLETELHRREMGPYFSSDKFSLVDCSFAPVFRYFDNFEAYSQQMILADFPHIDKWRKVLSLRDSVKKAVVDDYHERLSLFIKRKGGVLAKQYHKTVKIYA